MISSLVPVTDLSHLSNVLGDHPPLIYDSFTLIVGSFFEGGEETAGIHPSTVQVNSGEGVIRYSQGEVRETGGPKKECKNSDLEDRT